MRNLVIYILVCFCSVFNSLCAQTEAGDFSQIDLNVKFKAIEGVESVEISIQDDLPVLLDFGTMRCGPCISSLIKMDSLYNEFEGKVRMFMVTRERNADVLKFKSANGRIKDVSIPIITDDSLLHAVFEHQVQPHLVWIDSKRSYYASSNPSFLTKENLDRFTKGLTIDLIEKSDRPFDYQKGLFAVFTDVGAAAERVALRRFISGTIEGIYPRRVSIIDSLRNIKRQAAYNFPIAKIYAPLFGMTYSLNLFNNQIDCPDDLLDRILIPVNERDRLVWLEENTYCYEFEELLDKNESVSRQSLLQFLDSYFGFKVTLQARQTIVWFIKSSEQKIHPDKGGIFLFDFCKKLNNTNRQYFFDYDREDGGESKIIYSEKVLKMDFEELKQFLETQGFTLVPREMPVKKLIFTTANQIE